MSVDQRSLTLRVLAGDELYRDSCFCAFLAAPRPLLNEDRPIHYNGCELDQDI
jgi:hypothetical protein